jgi:hypothetical protein
MTSFKQVTANRLNARKSTGPRTVLGKQHSRCNALRHGLTAETVIAALECAADYRALEARLLAEHNPSTATERELVLRLASVLWRLRRSTSIETGLFQTEAQFMREADTGMSRRGRTAPPPEWLDELDIKGSVPSISLSPVDHRECNQALEKGFEQTQRLASCFLRVSTLGSGAFDLLHRYESALWRQAAQILFMLRSTARF